MFIIGEYYKEIDDRRFHHMISVVNPVTNSRWVLAHSRMRAGEENVGDFFDCLERGEKVSISNRREIVFPMFELMSQRRDQARNPNSQILNLTKEEMQTLVGYFPGTTRNWQEKEHTITVDVRNGNSGWEERVYQKHRPHNRI